MFQVIKIVLELQEYLEHSWHFEELYMHPRTTNPLNN